MDLQDEMLPVMLSLEQYGQDPALLDYCRSMGLGNPNGYTCSIEDVRDSLLTRLKNKIEDSYTNVAAKWRRHKERKERKGISDEGVVYPKVTPSEVMPFEDPGRQIMSILTTLVTKFDPQVVKTNKGLDAFQQAVASEFRVIHGVIGKPSILVEKHKLTFHGFGTPAVSVKEYADRDIGESVNGWTLPQLNSTRNTISSMIEKILYLMKRIVGRVNSLSFDAMDQYAPLLHAVDSVQFALRVIRALFNDWIGSLTRVHLYSLA